MEGVVMVFKLGCVQIKLDMAVTVYKMRPENVLTFLLAQVVKRICLSNITPERRHFKKFLS